MKNALGVILLISAALLQVTLAGRITLLHAPANIVLLVMLAWSLQEFNNPDWRLGLLAGLMLSLFSAYPVWVLLLSYSAAAATAQFLQQRVWQVRLLTLFTSVAVGTVFIEGISVAYLWLNASPIGFLDAFNLVILPGIVFNMIFVIPSYALIRELSKILIPAEVNP